MLLSVRLSLDFNAVRETILSFFLLRPYKVCFPSCLWNFFYTCCVIKRFVTSEGKNEA